MNVLVINTYGGSLLVGARMAGATVIGSLEDAGFGVEVQRANFPDVEVVDRVPWPDLDLDLDLTDVYVLAHPPCSAFSGQNTKAAKRGEDTDAFGCHKRVMEYALGSNCAGLAIESVCGAGTAEATYRKTAAAHGYECSLIYLNSVSFGVPQWRNRLWIIFRRHFDRTPITAPRKYRVVGDIVRETGTRAHLGEASIQGILDKLPSGMIAGEYGPGSVLALTSKVHPAMSDATVAEMYGFTGKFQCKLPRILDEGAPATVVLYDSSWFVRGRHLWVEEYDAIMGFPPGYVWPNLRKQKLYLSKGVCPPIVPWILETMEDGAMQEVNDLRPARRDVMAVIKSRRGGTAA